MFPEGQVAEREVRSVNGNAVRFVKTDPLVCQPDDDLFDHCFISTRIHPLQMPGYYRSLKVILKIILPELPFHIQEANDTHNKQDRAEEQQEYPDIMDIL